MAHDMTNGSPVKLILGFSIPLLIGNVFQQLYSMMDTVIVGRTISVQALAAVGATGSITFLVLGLIQGMTSGFSVVVAQRYGANDEQGVRHAVAASAILSVISIVVVTTISMLATRPLLVLMRTPADIIEDSYTYLIIVFAGIAAIMFYNLVSNIIRALGDSRTPLVFLIIACIINIILDLLFIMVFKMGVAGAAYATVVAQFISGILCLIYAVKRYPILRIRKSDFKLPAGLIYNELKIGLPMGFQFSVTAIGVMIIQSVLNGFGSNTVAAYTAAARIGDLAAMPLGSIGVTMATYAAQNYGANKLHRVRDGVKKALLISLIFSLVGGAVLFFLGKPLIHIFIESSQVEIVNTAKIYLNVISGFLFVLGVLFIFRNTLQGIGLSVIPMTAGACELVMRGLIAVIVASMFGFVGVCFAEPLAWLGADIPLTIRYLMLAKQIKKKEQESDPENVEAEYTVSEKVT